MHLMVMVPALPYAAAALIHGIIEDLEGHTGNPRYNEFFFLIDEVPGIHIDGVAAKNLASQALSFCPEERLRISEREQRRNQRYSVSLTGSKGHNEPSFLADQHAAHCKGFLIIDFFYLGGHAFRILPFVLQLHVALAHMGLFVFPAAVKIRDIGFCNAVFTIGFFLSVLLIAAFLLNMKFPDAGSVYTDQPRPIYQIILSHLPFPFLYTIAVNSIPSAPLASRLSATSIRTLISH